MGFLGQQAKEQQDISAEQDRYPRQPGERKKLRRRGFVWLVIGCTALVLVGLFFLGAGWIGWTSGEVRIQMKGQASYAAKEHGLHELDFYLYTWGAMVGGAVAALAGLFALVSLPFRPAVERDILLEELGRPPARSRDSEVPGWAVVMVLAGFFATLIWILLRH